MKIIRAEPSLQYQFHDESFGLLEKILIKSRRERPDFNRRMFDEDFARIFHISNHHTDNLFDISSSDDKLTNRLFGNVRTQYEPYSIDETIREMIEDIAQSLLWFGEAHYFLRDDPSTEETHITGFSSESIFTLGRVCFQFLPKRYERHWRRDNKLLGRELRLLNRKKLMCFHLPKSIRRMLSSQNSILGSLDKYQHANMEFLPKVTYGNPNPHNDFNFLAWSETHDFALYQATRKTGWNGRKYDSEKRSDFFDCHRLIKFRRNQVVLRDHILAQLSDELTKVGKYYIPEFKIAVLPTKTLPSVKELDELESRLSREEAGFTEVMDFCFNK
ncbi:hypothetical protein [Vreelandella neptunia]|uniref:Uncharacterized protein n=1 Tax=Vreelandella neptunia TaxID=115551 RepID=A0ABS9S2V6_9GAMM|nr:hypothetical protein [Halomonas neptunia]MCH4810428.1 hypothetical protein [Halomonas neptunia]